MQTATVQNTTPTFQKKTLQRRNLKHLTLEDSTQSLAGLSIDGSAATGLDNRSHLKRPLVPNRLTLSDDLTTGNAPAAVVVVHTTRKNSQTSINSSSNVSPLSANTPDELVSSGLESTVLKTAEFDSSKMSVGHDNQIELQNLVQLGKIGAGNSGMVVKVLHVPDSRIIAKKVIPVETNNETVIKQLIRELSIMQRVHSHPNIVEFYGAFYNPSTSNDLIILLEYMNCGSLDKILSVYKSFVGRGEASPNESWFTPLVISRISDAVLTGLIYLYDTYKIIHRDIKPSNVLVSSKGQIKICDFGVSKILINSIADTFVGTSTYMSPERIQGDVYSTKGDVWSLGLMIIELVTGKFPLTAQDDTPDGILGLLQQIVNEPAPRLPSGYTIEMTDFVNRCCIKQEQERPSLKELSCHDFIGMYRSKNDLREFKHWCKKAKIRLKTDKQIKREEAERAKFEKRQLERSAAVATRARR